jgi:hypothetical protein
MSDEVSKYDEFAARMTKRFPKMLDGKYGGFAVGEGWWPILESLCANIQGHIDHANTQFEKYGRGQLVEQVVVEQVKEKFGGLRFYYTGGDEQIYGMVRMAEAWADASCEECGAPGKSRNGGWIKTLCDRHELERQERRKQYDAK